MTSQTSWRCTTTTTSSNEVLDSTVPTPTQVSQGAVPGQIAAAVSVAGFKTRSTHALATSPSPPTWRPECAPVP